jgi:hypothetical protein
MESVAPVGRRIGIWSPKAVVAVWFVCAVAATAVAMQPTQKEWKSSTEREARPGQLATLPIRETTVSLELTPAGRWGALILLLAGPSAFTALWLRRQKMRP